ncbi:MAG TPA: glycosyltransferase family 9 protein [Rhodanobacteraceae bacterium]|nr:glycosyltransferase family 9 protein [Rhodanobacteraceae bacterium]
MTALAALSFSAGIEDLRRRVTARMMRGVFRAGGAGGARLPRSGIHRVLICRSVHTLGDSLTLTPLLTELAELYPGAEVDVVCGCPVADALFKTFPNVRNVRRMPRHVAGHLLATARTLHAMRRTHYDLVIDPDPQSQSGRLLALSAHATYSLGYVGPKKSGTLTHGVMIPADLRHKAMTPVYLLRSATGQDPAARDYPQPTLMLTDAELECGRRTMTRLMSKHQPGAGGPCIGIFANATRDKLLAGGWWLDFIEAFRRSAPGTRIVEILPAFGKSMLEDRFACFYSSDVRKLAALIANLDAYVSADCGVMHLAWATGTPTVGLFNATHPAEWGPFGPRMGALPLDDATTAEVARLTIELLGLPSPANGANDDAAA